MNLLEKCFREIIRFLILIVFGLGPISESLYAQISANGRSELRGIVVEDTIGVPDVHILNLSGRTATISDAEGYFRVEVKPGDTLVFSAVRYRRTSLVITNEVLDVSSILIPLVPLVNELDEVVVTPYNLSGNLDTDLGRLPEVNPVSAFSLGLPNAAARRLTQTENRLHEATTGGGIVPLNPILNAITGRTKQLKKQLALEKRYELAIQMRGYFPDSLYVKQLRIPEDRLADFIYFCEVDSVFSEVANSRDLLRIWDFMERKSSDYRKFNSISD